MSGNNLKEDLSQLFWGVLAVFRSTTVPAGAVPAGTESLSVPVAVAQAMMLVYRSEGEQVQAALRRVEGALLDQRDDADRRVDLYEYNQRIRSIIQDERAKWHRLEADVEALQAEMDRRP